MEDMTDKENQFIDPDDFEEIDDPEELDEELEDDELETNKLNVRILEVLDDIDFDDIEGFEFCEFNEKSIEAIAVRVHSKKKRFLNKTESKDPDDLSIANPKYNDKLKFGANEYSWWRFLDEIVRDAFPGFSFRKYGVNRFDMFSVIIDNLVLPLIKADPKEIIRIDGSNLEKEFNKKLLMRLVQLNRIKLPLEYEEN